MMKLALMSSCLVGVLFCGAGFTQTADELAISKAYKEWSAATNAKNIDLWTTFLAPEAVFFPPDRGVLNTQNSIRQYYLELFADPNFTLPCQQHSVEIALSGDLAWSTGRCAVTFTDSDGNTARGKSKWAKVWEKQVDGSWKCRLNIWNSDPF